MGWRLGMSSRWDLGCEGVGSPASAGRMWRIQALPPPVEARICHLSLFPCSSPSREPFWNVICNPHLYLYSLLPKGKMIVFSDGDIRRGGHCTHTHLSSLFYTLPCLQCACTSLRSCFHRVSTPAEPQTCLLEAGLKNTSLCSYFWGSPAPCCYPGKYFHCVFFFG